MIWEVRQTRRFARAYKKLHDNVAADVDVAIDQVAANPDIGEKKKGDLAQLWVHKFRSQGQLYLLGYTRDDGLSSSTLRPLARTRTFIAISSANLLGLRESLGMEVGFSLPSERVIRALEQVMEWRGRPLVIRCDNGPENISGLIQNWAVRRGIRLEHIQPGKPQQNAYVERFNRTVRYEWLSQCYWDSLEEVQEFATCWMWTYNHERPNMALGGITPIKRLAMAACSTSDPS